MRLILFRFVLVLVSTIFIINILISGITFTIQASALKFTNTLNIENTTSTLNYNMTGNNNRIENITLINDGILILNIDSKSSGILAIELPRGIIDSKSYISSNPPDSRFTVFIDDSQLALQQVKEVIKNDYMRILNIPFIVGSNIIEIIGTESLRGVLLPYKKPTIEIEFQYPGYWEMIKDYNPSELLNTYKLVEFKIQSPNTPAAPTTVSISVENLPHETVNLKDYVNGRYIILNRNPTFERVDDSPITVGDIPAWQIEYTNTNESIHGLIIYIIYGKKAYEISMESGKTSFPVELIGFQKMINSIKFNN